MPRPVDQNDNFRQMLLKNIPSEIIAVYVAALGAVFSAQDPPAWPKWLVFGVCLAATPLWLFFFQDVKKALQLVLASISFVIFGMTIPGPFDTIPGWIPAIGSVALVLFSGLIAPFLSMAFLKKA